jgi:hypothetical protein
VTDLATEIVTAIASGAGDSLGATTVEGIKRLISALRAKFRGDPGSRGTLEIALETPDDSDARKNLMLLLRDRIQYDAEFEEWLTNLWAEIGPSLKMDKSTNIVRGSVYGNVVQSRDVYGRINISGE